MKETVPVFHFRLTAGKDSERTQLKCSILSREKNELKPQCIMLFETQGYLRVKGGIVGKKINIGTCTIKALLTPSPASI